MYIVSIFLHTRQAQRTKGTRPLARWRSVVVLIVYVYLLHIVLFIDRYFILCCALEGILWGLGQGLTGKLLASSRRKDTIRQFKKYSMVSLLKLIQ